MEFYADNILLIVFLPVWVCLIIISGIIFKITESKKLTLLLTLLSTFTGLIFSLNILNYVKTNNLVLEKNFLWLSTGEINLYFGVLTDSTSAIFIVLLMLISFIVQLYSYGYMKDKDDFRKYYVYLNFFNFAMSGLIISTNIFQTYIFWELVGVASYLLIAFYYRREDVSKAAKRVFIINRIGDFAFLSGIIIFIWFSLTYLNRTNLDILMYTSADNTVNSILKSAYINFYNVFCFLILIGCFVKSAQFPFNLWLTDAMKAPSPVSALIHSATMVCAGIYVTIRFLPLLSQELLNLILITGIVTAVLCSFIAASQTNIKKMLAYSTSSQLGLIFAAVGVQAISAAVIYLVIHSFTKALLFLCAGNIEKKYNSIQDMDVMGGLRKQSFYDALYWLVGALSLSGLFFGGFTSKEILINTVSSNPAVLFFVLLTSYISTYYIFKAYFRIFEGDKTILGIDIQKSEKTMSASIIILCVFVIIPGFIFKLSRLNLLCLLAVMICLLAVVHAYISSKTSKMYIPCILQNLSYKELYLPKVYDFIESIFSKAFIFIALIEQVIFENIVKCINFIIRSVSKIISKLQNGNIQTYISYSIFSTGLILFVLIFTYYVTEGV